MKCGGGEHRFVSQIQGTEIWGMWRWKVQRSWGQHKCLLDPQGRNHMVGLDKPQAVSGHWGKWVGVWKESPWPLEDDVKEVATFSQVPPKLLSHGRLQTQIERPMRARSWIFTHTSAPAKWELFPYFRWATWSSGEMRPAQICPRSVWSLKPQPALSSEAQWCYTSRVDFVFYLMESSPFPTAEPFMEGLVRYWVWGSVLGRVHWNMFISTLFLWVA